MSYQNFYIQSGGSNANSGTLSVGQSTPAVVWANAASVVFTSSGASSTLTATDSTMSAIQMGDLINVGGTCIVIVTAVSNVGSAYTITFNMTAGTFWGTSPTSPTTYTNTTGSTGRVIDGGAWLDLTQGIITGTSTIPQSTQILVSQTATLSNTGNVSYGLKGTVSLPLWFRGYHSSLGDLDNGSTTLSYPTVTGTGQITIASPYSKWSGFVFTSSVNGTAVNVTGNPVRFYHCQFANTGANAGGYAFQPTDSICVNCSFTSTATSTTIVNVTSPGQFFGCDFVGAGSGSTQSAVTQGGGSLTLNRCTFQSPRKYGVAMSANAITSISACTFYSCGSDAINIASGLGTTVMGGIISNAFFNSGGYNINNTGSLAGYVFLAGNLNYNAISGHLNGFGDQWESGTTNSTNSSPTPNAAVAALTDSSQSYVSATNLQLLSTSAGANAAGPQQWENLTAGEVSTPDVGAWQRTAGTTGGGPVGNNFRGGFIN